MRRRTFLFGAVSTILLGCQAGASESGEAIGPLISPADLAARIDQVGAGRVAVLYVGPEVLFKRGHIPGARNIGEAGTPKGRDALLAALARLPRETEIVLYCGCCPVRNCPNVRPASAAIRAAGRPNTRVLDLPTRFANDWADKGYPVERG